jgi:DNA invertase Pin-like site-specific DNA recombinase
MMQKIYKVAIYIRLSREDGDKEESSSVTNQRDIITRFVKENENFIIINEYVDDGYTGTNFNRPAFQRMLQDIEKGLVDTVITKDLSRLGRDYIDTGHYVQRYFPEKKVRYIAILDNIDTLEDAGMNDIAPFKSVINDMYVKDISKKIRSALEERKKSGNFLGVTAPYGYMKNPDNKFQLIINEEEAKVVRYIFDLYLQGNGLTKISQILTEKGIPVPGVSRDIGTTRKTKLYDCWKQTTVSRILRNQVYIGNLEQFKRKKLNYKSKIRVTVPEEERYICENTHEPIINKEKFEQVQAIITGNTSFKTGTKHDYLFKGLLYCADCGSKLYLTYSNYAFKKYGEYRYTTICYTYSKLFNQCSRHSNSIPILEKLLIANIKKVCSLYINKNLEDELIQIAEIERQKENSIDNYKNKMQTIDKKIEDTSLYIKNLYIDKVKGIINDKEFMELSKSFENERQNYIKQKEELIKLSSKIEMKKDNNSMIENLAKQFISLEKPTKELLQQLIEKITISEDNEVTIYFKFKELNDLSRLEENKMPNSRTVNKRNKKAS